MMDVSGNMTLSPSLLLDRSATLSEEVQTPTSVMHEIQCASSVNDLEPCHSIQIKRYCKFTIVLFVLGKSKYILPSSSFYAYCTFHSVCQNENQDQTHAEMKRWVGTIYFGRPYSKSPCLPSGVQYYSNRGRAGVQHEM